MAEPIQGGGPVNSILPQTPQTGNADESDEPDEAQETEDAEAETTLNSTDSPAGGQTQAVASEEESAEADADADPSRGGWVDVLI